jgi:hypothetical protein
MSGMPTVQVAGVYHRHVGDLTITALSDGHPSGDGDIMRNNYAINLRLHFQYVALQS